MITVVNLNSFRRIADSQPVNMAQRLILAIGGGYLLAAGTAALSARLLAIAMPPSEAVMLMGMLAFVVYLIALIWAFSERRLLLVWAVLGLGATLAFGVAEISPALAGAHSG